MKYFDLFESSFGDNSLADLQIKKDMAAKKAKKDIPFDGPYRPAGEKRTDQYGNEIKHVAKHLARKAAKGEVTEEFMYGPSDFDMIKVVGDYVLGADDHSEPGEKIAYSYYVLKKEGDKYRKVRNLDSRVNTGPGTKHRIAIRDFMDLVDTINEELNETDYEVNPAQRTLADIGRKLMDKAVTTKDDVLSTALSRVGNELTSYGTAFGARSIEELEKKTGIKRDSIMKMMDYGKRMLEKEGATKIADKDEVEEGKIANIAMGALLGLGAMWGAGEATSAKNSPLGDALKAAAQAGDTIAMDHYKNLDLYVDGNDQSIMKMLNSKYLKKKVGEVAPPGAKAERMVKHIKKGYAKDGDLTDTERSIAYATAWKHHNRKTEDAEPTLATNKRTERILNLLRAKSPTAKNDLEALILSFDKGQMQDRMDISRLYKDDESIEQAVARLEQEIARLKQQRTNESIEVDSEGAIATINMLKDFNWDKVVNLADRLDVAFDVQDAPSPGKAGTYYALGEYYDDVAEFGEHLHSLDPELIDLNKLEEAQFDEAAGEKDACYHKVKSRYKVWPSAYASGALVQCRKKGAANWGNSKKK